MMLHSFGREFRPWSEYAKAIHSELERRSSSPLDILEYSLFNTRFNDENAEEPFADYLGALFAKHPLDLIISVGAPAADFVQRHRPQLFPTVPMILTAVEQRRVRFSDLTENDTVVSVANDAPAVVETILQVLPDTKTVAIVNGNSPLENFWREVREQEFKRFEYRVKFIWYNTLSFEEILRNAASLPPNSAIFWQLMIVDAAGVVHEGDSALTKLHAVANAPIFSYDDAFFGRELVGGAMQSVENVSRQTAAVAIRILSGEKSSDIKTPPIGFATPKFDWRQMQRWGVRESRLPPGSEIYFREPSPWQLYRWQIIAAAATMLLQAALIGWLIYEHRRRHIAEVQSRSSMAELTYMNRVASAGLLSASLAHEVNQPLAGIVLKANAALHWLVAENTGEVRKALTQIAEAGHRAAGIITNVKAMFSKDTQEKSAVSINELIRAVLGLVHIDLRRHRVETQISLDSQLPPVLGNEIQLQQVILNLVMNAIEAMRSTEPRLLSIKSKVNQHGSVHVSIEDTGSGIEPSNMDHLFKPLFTTKERGMGMGLSICQSIIESHGGKIWVASVAPRGSAFQFELPTGATTLTQPENGADSIA